MCCFYFLLIYSYLPDFADCMETEQHVLLAYITCQKEYNSLWYDVCSAISQVVNTENNFKLKINMNKSD